jgi:hypothetical protein
MGLRKGHGTVGLDDTWTYMKVVTGSEPVKWVNRPEIREWAGWGQNSCTLRRFSVTID